MDFPRIKKANDTVKFTLLQSVYFRTDKDRENEGFVNGIVFRTSAVTYLVIWQDHTEEECEEQELFAKEESAPA